MMRWISLGMLLCLMFLPLLLTKARPQEAEAAGAPFPLGPLVGAARENTVVWSPDWAPSMPPDGFRLCAGNPASITLVMEDGAEYRARWNREGALTAFPALVHGAFAQVTREAASRGQPESLTVFGGAGTVTATFIGNPDPLSLARVTREGTVSFAAIRHDFRAETWYDAEGSVLAHFAASEGNVRQSTARSSAGESVTTRHYNSFGAVSAVESPEGAFSALYGAEHRPRYWKRQEAGAVAESLTLQWDGRGLLLSIKAEDSGAEIRYAYTLDSRGNWTERREYRMESAVGVLAPSKPAVVRRVISYR
jgi:hypothetical protein